MLAHEEIRALVIALGTSIADDFNLEKLRYHKIIMMADADVDGAHIRTLLLTLFYRYFPQIIEKGYLYIAQPPLYQIKKGNQIFYAYSDAEKERIIGNFRKTLPPEKSVDKKLKKETKPTASGDWEVTPLSANDDNIVNGANDETVSETAEKISGVNIQRYKGLGEMNAEQLWDTTMNPEKRVLLQVTIADTEKADEIFDILMGSEVMPRKKFIQPHAKNVKNLDI